MIRAVNHLGYNVEIHTPEGWQPTGEPHATREIAQAAMAAMQTPGQELRVYEALAGRA